MIKISSIKFIKNICKRNLGKYFVRNEWNATFLLGVDWQAKYIKSQKCLCAAPRVCFATKYWKFRTRMNEKFKQFFSSVNFHNWRWHKRTDNNGKNCLIWQSLLFFHLTNAKKLYIDATFSIAPKPFYQCIVVIIF